MTDQTPLDVAADFLRVVEGFSAAPYQDSKGVWTIGCGTTWISGEPVTRTTPACTQSQAAAWLEADMQTAWHGVQSGVSADATTDQLAAFVSFAYNEGVRAFLGSMLLALFNNGDVAGCEEQFPRWVYISEGGALVELAGLVNRRAAELALFRGAWVAPVAVQPVGAVFRIGDKGAAVAAAQTKLASAGFYARAIDGVFGEQTQRGVMLFQNAQGLAVDGVIGAATAARLGL